MPSAEKKKETHKFGIDSKADLQLLLEKCRELLPSYDENLIKLAFNYCVIAHEGKLRKSGDKFYTHPLAVAFVVLEEIPLDDVSVIAALLHNVTDESNVYTYEDIKFTFGTTIAQIVEGVSRIKFVESQHIDRPDQMENYRKLLLSLFTDIRIILIKLADKLHNMRTLNYVSPESQIKRATETLEIYAPFANRFGLRKIKFELEDLSFKYLNPVEYKKISETIKGTHQERELYVEKFKQPIIKLIDEEKLLQKHNITYEISGRAKHIYSIYNKTLLRQKKVEELYDIFAIRIILDTDNPLFCFYVYGIIANYYKPIPETFKDYISSPKSNGYQSLHTAVAGPDDKIVEVQIRTLQMHNSAEVGLSAHFRYKTNVPNTILEDNNIQQWFDEVRNIFENVSAENSSRLYDIISNNMLRDSIYVFTPKDEFKKLPKGSTALDFAFEIHSEIGFTAITAKVNGKPVALNHVLASGDKVEILTTKNQKPKVEWLDFVITPKASTKLLKYFNSLEKELILKGKNIWNEKNKKYGFTLTSEEFDFVISSFNFNKPEEFYKSIADGSLDVEKAHKFSILKISDKIKSEILETNSINKSTKFPDKNITSHNSYYDFDINKVSFATCCSPIPQVPIFATLEQNKSIIVHSVACTTYNKLLHISPQSILQITWKQLVGVLFNIKLRLVAKDSEDIIQQVIDTLIKYPNLELKSITQETNNSIFIGYFEFIIDNTINFQELISELEHLEGVNSIEKIS